MSQRQSAVGVSFDLLCSEPEGTAAMGSRTDSVGEFDFQPGHDLAGLACNAALELDNVLLGHEVDFRAVPRLIRWLSESFPRLQPGGTGGSIDSMSVAMMSRAIQEAEYLPVKPSTVDEINSAANQIRTSLGTIQTSKTQRLGTEDIARLRTLFLSLSKTASVQESPFADSDALHALASVM